MRMIPAGNVICGRCGVVRCGPEWSLDRAWSERLQDYDIWYVWSGRGRMELTDGSTLQLEPGLCVCMRPGRLYLATQDLRAPLGVTYGHFSLRGGATAADLPPEHRHVEDPAWLDATLRRMVELIERGGREHLAASLLATVLNDLRQPVETSATATDRLHLAVVEQAVATVRQRIADGLSPADLAQSAGYSLDHFTRIFREIRGQSPQQFIITERVRAAQSLLSESSLSVQQIAAALGYSSVYFFSRQFKQVTGRPPSRWSG